jgi:hypothetical protein
MCGPGEPVNKPTFLRFAILLSALALLPACGKSVGSKCKPGEALCSTKTTALTCQGGKLAQVACRGPLGCTKFQEKANCDDSEAAEGDTCMGDGDDEYACTSDKKRALVCKNGRFVLSLVCRGKGGCALLGR